MESASRCIVRHAYLLAKEIDARAVLVYADAVCRDEELRRHLSAVGFPTILISRSREPAPPGLESHAWVAVPDVHMTRAGQVKTAVLVCLARGILHQGDRVVCLAGVDGSGAADGLLVLSIGDEPELFSFMGPAAFGGDVAPAVFERTLTLASQLAVEGREGRPVGAPFVVGDSEAVLAQSRGLVLNPFKGHPEAERNLLDPGLEETVKEFSALDGAFVVRGDGVVLAAGIQLLPAAHPRLPGGLGTRHAAAAGITAATDAVAVCVSQSTGTVTIFQSGRLVTDLPRPAQGGRLAG